MAPPPSDDDQGPPSSDIDTADFTEIDADPSGRGLLSRTGRSLSRVLRRARGAAADIEMSARPRALARRLAERARGVLPIRSAQRSVEALLHALSDPRTARQAHWVMSSLGQVGFEVAFRQEPHARLMFELAEWCGAQASRGHVMAILMADATQPEGAVAQLYATLLGGNPLEGAPVNPLAVLLSEPPSERLDRALGSVQRSLMRTLCTLVAVATGDEAPEPDAELYTLIDQFRRADLPEQFEPLPDFILGLDAVEGRGEATHPWGSGRDIDPAGSEHSSDEGAPGADAGAYAHGGALTTHRPAVQLRRVVTAYLLFVETYMVRNMVDALPTLMERIREEMDHDSTAPKEHGPGDPMDDVEMEDGDMEMGG